MKIKSISFLFIKHELENWTGGNNYYKNLIYLLADIHHLNIIILTDNFAYARQNISNKKIKIVELSILKRSSFFYYLRKVIAICFKYDVLLLKKMRELNIFFSSHKALASNKITSAGWIPDLQHVHLKQFFSKRDLIYRDKLFQNIINNSDIIFCSSEFGKKDIIKYYSIKDSDKIIPLKFPYLENDKDFKQKKFNKNKKNFLVFFPSQYWMHKNHEILISVSEIIKKNNDNISIICSGNVKDYRNKNHYQNLINKIKKKKLEDVIQLKDFLDRGDYLNLFKNCDLIINPSKFEGWSTIVEEARYYCKYICLSNIPVHLEQNHPGAFYFNPNKCIDLYNLILNLKKKKLQKKNIEKDCRKSRSNLVKDIKKKYSKILKGL